MLSSARLSCVALFVAAAVSACSDNSPTTPVTQDATYSITPSVAESATYPAGSVIALHTVIKLGTSPVYSATVGWSVIAGGGSVAPISTITDTLGGTTVSWVLGAAAGVNTLVISIGTKVDTLHVNGVIGKPSYIVPQSADSVAIAAGAATTLQAKVTDVTGNPVPGTTVNWTTSGGTLSAATTTTIAGGLASVTFSAATAGTYFVVAELPGQATRTFQVVVR